MPIYEYECSDCENLFEVVQKFNDKPFAKCPKCNTCAQRIISTSAFILKGTGWYKTDYPSEDRKKAIKAEKKDNKQPSKENKKKEKTVAGAASSTAV